MFARGWLIFSKRAENISEKGAQLEKGEENIEGVGLPSNKLWIYRNCYITGLCLPGALFLILENKILENATLSLL